MKQLKRIIKNILKAGGTIMTPLVVTGAILNAYGASIPIQLIFGLSFPVFAISVVYALFIYASEIEL